MAAHRAQQRHAQGDLQGAGRAKDPEDAEVAVFYFGAAKAGGTEANIQRWIGQFPDAKPTDMKRTERTRAA